jgi:hypothetical protein
MSFSLMHLKRQTILGIGFISLLVSVIFSLFSLCLLLLFSHCFHVLSFIPFRQRGNIIPKEIRQCFCLQVIILLVLPQMIKELLPPLFSMPHVLILYARIHLILLLQPIPLVLLDRLLLL